MSDQSHNPSVQIVWQIHIVHKLKCTFPSSTCTDDPLTYESMSMFDAPNAYESFDAFLQENFYSPHPQTFNLLDS